MRKLILILFAGVFSFTITLAQDAESDSTAEAGPWKVGGRIGVNFSNVSLSNWAGGGQESVSGTANALFTADYEKDKVKWKNSLELGYGLIQQGEGEVVKSDDQINFASVYTRNFRPKWSYSGTMTFRSQFAPGYNPPDSQTSANLISDWLAPAYFQAAIGIEYSPFDYLQFSFYPATYKLTIVMDQNLADNGDYGVEAAVRDTAGNIITSGENFRSEIGGSFQMVFKKEILKNVELESNLNLFSNYLEDPTVIDVNWVNNLNMKINEFMTASFLTNLIYDQDIKIAAENDPNDVAPRVQFKSVLGIGLAYKF